MKIKLKVLLIIWVIPVSLCASELQTQLNEKAHQILKERCSRCHGNAARQAGLDVLSRKNLTEMQGAIGSEFAFIVPGDVSSSILADTIDGGVESYMPKEGSPEAKAMTDGEKQQLIDWIAAGAEFPTQREVEFVTDTMILKAMRDRLLSAKADDRKYLRFYTFHQLHNNNTVSEADMRLYRAAFAKAVNSLSRERHLYIPEALPKTYETVFVLDLRDVGWDEKNKWGEIVRQYPYALKFDFVKDEELKEIWKDVSLFTESDMPYLRADWFVVTATRPPLYHKLLEIPETLQELEYELQLNILENFLRGDVARSGFAKSGVSQQNRLLERHSTAVTPYFWISYDFLPRKAQGDLVRFPLGPQFDGNPFAYQAFEHDGGEIIWSLPNGLQAYMLVDDKGRRIDQGPIEVVFDRSAVLGTPAIINGISCIYCHRDGMISNFRDEIRSADAVGGLSREHVLKTYPPHEKMQELTRQDQDIFQRALERVIGPFLLVGGDKGKAITDFPEPIGKVAEMYSRDLTPIEIACELGIENGEILQSKIETNRELLRFGMGTITQDPPGTLKREKWESKDGTSLMQDVASELRIGLPYVP